VGVNEQSIVYVATGNTVDLVTCAPDIVKRRDPEMSTVVPLMNVVSVSPYVIPDKEDNVIAELCFDTSNADLDAVDGK
jgi:hypothetical protein